MQTLNCSTIQNRNYLNNDAVKTACSVILNKWRSGIINIDTFRDNLTDFGYALGEQDVEKYDAAAHIARQVLDNCVTVTMADLNFQEGKVFANKHLVTPEFIEELKTKRWTEFGNIVIFEGEAVSMRDFLAAIKRLA